MDMDTLLLLIAFRHRIKEPNFAGGFSRFQEIVERTIEEDDFRTALGRAVAADRIAESLELGIATGHGVLLRKGERYVREERLQDGSHFSADKESRQG